MLCSHIYGYNFAAPLIFSRPETQNSDRRFYIRPRLNAIFLEENPTSNQLTYF